MRATFALALALTTTHPLLAAPKPQPPDLRSPAITRAHTVFLTDAEPSDVAAIYQSFRTTLESTHRFTLSPTPAGADLLLIFDRAHGGPFIQVALCDPHTALPLGTVEARWANLPNAAKNAEAVTRLLNAFFSLDRSGPPPAFQAALVPDIPNKSRILSGFRPLADAVLPNPQDPGIGTVLQQAKTLLIVNHGISTDFRDEFQQTSTDFSTRLAAANRFRIVTDLKDADLILRVYGYVGCAFEKEGNYGQTHCTRHEKVIAIEVDSAATLNRLFTSETVVSTNFNKSMPEVEKNFIASFDKTASHP